MKFYLCLLFLVVVNVLSHTTKICAVTNQASFTTQASVTFYACTNNNISDVTGVTGKLYVDGEGYNFTQLVPYNSTLIPASAKCISCNVTGVLRACQVVTVQGLDNGYHSVGTSCSSAFECPLCNYPRLNLTNIDTNPCTVDGDPPCVTCVKTVRVYVDNLCRAVMPDITNKTYACDRCSPTRISQSIPQGTSLSLGQINVTMTAIDVSNNFGTCETVVNVIDNIPPTLTLVPSVATLWPPNHKMVNVSINFSFSDNCPLTNATQSVLQYNITNVVVDDPGNGSGNTAVDWNIINRNLVELRAERSGTGNGRTYYIVGFGLDGNNNIVFATTTVVVPHNM
ncbi:T9SS C-terminal target domain-containing protein [Yasminevirus sp. GU-2018]|uniref:T9SS C-terminal target domain-containing protein n=1 Tax=Yasminevirus sp. GU-2018 TaxID=2420051 RepID=A0A5K0U8C0_9VIRU|nr:T9SS C-terminal target domain-containing protein [Yasminevirus sp. GU-2018]